MLMLSVLPTHFSLKFKPFVQCADGHLMHQVVSLFVSMKSQKDPAKEYAFEAFLSHLDPKEHETAILVPTAERGAKN